MRVKLDQDRLEQLVRFGEWVRGMSDVLAEMARECGALFVGKVELHLKKFPWFEWISTASSPNRAKVVWCRSRST